MVTRNFWLVTRQLCDPQYHNLISLEADQLQDLKVRVKELNNGDYNKELNAINQAQQKLYEALKALATE